MLLFVMIDGEKHKWAEVVPSLVVQGCTGASICKKIIVYSTVIAPGVCHPNSPSSPNHLGNFD